MQSSNRLRLTLGVSVIGACSCAGAPADGPASGFHTAPPSSASTLPVASMSSVTAPPAPKPGSFEDDLAFLQAHGDVIVLDAPGGGHVAVSPKYQGRVMTSAVATGAKSLGFVFRKFIEEGKTGTQFDNYGGEDRFWLGPEAGQYGLYFPKGKPFEIANWQTPEAFQVGAWDVKEKAADHVTFTRSMKIVNYAGTTFELDVVRTVRVLDAKTASDRLGAPLGADLQWVGFETENTITNTGKVAWTKQSGLLSVWILSMLTPTSDTFVAAPFEAKASGDVVHDAYFGKVPAERLQVDDKGGVLFFACDGTYRSKIGLPPLRAKPFIGSYSAAERLLTIVSYDKPAGAKDYVNSMWEKQKDPFGGDVVNSYNDGPTEPGKPSLGGFYEIETSSPAAALAPGASLVHVQRTFHFVGAADALDAIATKTLGVTTGRIAEGVKKP